MRFWDAYPRSRLLTDVSLWSSDLGRISEEIRRIDPFVDSYHIDVSDAHFTPSLLFFPDLVAAVRSATKKPFHVHLMVENPLDLIDSFVDAGAGMISVHAGNEPCVRKCITKILERGCAAGIALNLGDEPFSIIPYLDCVNVVIVLGTLPGLKGQALSVAAYSSLEIARDILRKSPRSDEIRLSADGGIRAETVPLLRAAGADIVVVGSLAFKSQDPRATFDWLYSL